MDVEKENRAKVVDLDDKRAKEQRLKRLQDMIDQGDYKVSADQIADAFCEQESSSLDIPSPPLIEKNSKKE